LYKIKVISATSSNIRISYKTSYTTKILFLMCFYLMRSSLEFGALVQSNGKIHFDTDYL